MQTVLFLGITTSLLAEDIKDVKGPVSFPPSYVWLILILLSVLVALGYLLNRYLRKRRDFAGDPVRDKLPHERAYESLDELKSKNLPGRGLVKEYYICLSDIVRRYIEARFDLKAPEMTTEEFLFYLRNSDRLSGSHKNLLKEFLNLSDIVKFAKYGPSLKETEESFNVAKVFVDETRKVDESVQAGETVVRNLR